MSVTKNSSSTSTRSVPRHLAGDRRQRVALAGMLAQALVHAAHETVEVRAVRPRHALCCDTG
jgi:hypothetical protein